MMRLKSIQPWRRRIITFLAVVCYMCMDLYEEFTSPEDEDETFIIAIHHWFEVAVALLVLWALWSEISGSQRLRQRLAVEESRRRQLSKDLAGHISARFLDWKLTRAETEIAWLLIKGFRFSEIAELRKVKEKTLRQQASQIYTKANVKGRSELSAGFLEDLLSPP